MVWNRRDQVQAYQFLRRRVVAALTQGDPNTGERPGRRLTVAALSGAAVAVLALGVSGVLGIVRHSAPNDWAGGGKVIVERETGARFVIDGNDVLRPVLNYTSALLFIGKPAGVVTVSRADLGTRRRGLPIGILNAPDGLPATAALLSGPWTTCSQARLDQTGVQRPQLSLSVGYPAPAGAALTQGAALVVRDAATATGDEYVVTQGMRYAVTDPALLGPLNLDATSARAVPVSGGWLSTLPQGSPLEPIQVPQHGEPGPRIAGRSTRVGQVFTWPQPGRADQLYVLLADGLTPVGPLTAALVRVGSGKHQTAAAPLDAQALLAPLSPTGLHATLPATLPTPAPLPPDQAAVCATWTDPSSGAVPQLTVQQATPGPPGVSAPPTAAVTGRATAADVVAIPPGRGALVRAPCKQGCLPAMEPFLITDAGARYRLGSNQVLTALGYDQSAPRAVPPALLALLPTGPDLDPKAVQAPRSGGAVLTMPATASVALQVVHDLQ